MNKIYKLSALWIVCLVLFSGLSFTACDNGDDEDTNQYLGGISLNVYGPSPVARGGELRFLGSGMDKVTAVVIPGCDEIIDIKVVSDAEIRIVVPQTAMPGLVTLKTPTGEIVTKTKLTYTEPISIENFSPVSIKSGEELTITGEYLNLIEEVIFSDNAVVTSDAFTKHERKEITLRVPAEAKTGKLIISDGAEIPNWIYSETELNIVLPSVEATADLTAKKPGDEVVVVGENLDLVEQVLMPNGDEVNFAIEEIAVTAQTKSAGNKYKLTFTLPENVSDGTIVMVPASGVKVAIANIGVAQPSDVKAEPAKDLRAGDIITLQGVNMELVTTVVFPGVDKPVEPSSKTATEVQVKMPELAISGSLTLNTASGKNTTVEIATQKPQFEAYANNAVASGADVTLKGKNLDLVAKVIFNGGASVSVEPSSSTELTLKVPVKDAVTGAVTLEMANGENVEISSLTIEKPEFCYIPEPLTAELEIHAGGVLPVVVANGDKLTSISWNDASVQYIYNETSSTVYINVPLNARKTNTMVLKSSNGEISYTITAIPAGEVQNVIFSGLVSLSWEDGGRVLIDGSAFSGIPGAAKLVLTFQQTENWGQVQFNDGNWKNDQVSFPELGGCYLTTDNVGGKTVTEIELSMSAELVAHFAANNGIVLQGSDWIISKIAVKYKNAVETVIFKGPLSVGAWSEPRVILGKEVFADVEVGAIMKVYYNEQAAWGQLQFNNGNWKDTNIKFPELDNGAYLKTDMFPKEQTEVELTLNEGTLNEFKDSGIVIQGENWTINKISIIQ